MPSPGVTFNLTCGKGVTELQNLTNLCLSSFAESHQMQQKNLTSPLKYQTVKKNHSKLAMCDSTADLQKHHSNENSAIWIVVKPKIVYLYYLSYKMMQNIGLSNGITAIIFVII